ncbi:MAG TPA: hypothetical protein DIT64_11370 [Verrucomicrobiales bacterium]|nr:hypothetical protein [Verrucomicrobiales bacterium]
MVEYDRSLLRDESGSPALRTCIVGVGGAGGNVIDRITLDRTVDAKLVAMHTDVRVLSHSMAPVKIQLGADLMRGVGAGGDPDLGREAAMFSREEIRQEIDGHDIVFICAGLGGGTGSGAAPVVAEIAKSTGALVLVTATMPFDFEGRRRLAQAEEALAQLQKRADALVLFENNRMCELILPKDGIQKAFAQADQLIAQSLRAVSTIVTLPGLVKLGLDDLTSALSTSDGRCLFGFGEARGQHRGAEALKRALKSPLIDQGRLLHQTRTLLVHIAGGESLTLVEVDTIMKQLGRHVPDHTHILFGVAVDARLADSVSVTLVSSLGLAQLNTVAAAAPPAEMLPLTDRPMPSVAAAVIPGLKSKVITPPAPKEVRKQPPPPAASVPAAAAAAAADPSLDLIFTDDEIIVHHQPEDASSPVTQDEFELEAPSSSHDLPPAQDEVEFEHEDDYDVSQETPSDSAADPEPEPAPEQPAPEPEKPRRLRIEDFMTPPPEPDPVPPQAPVIARRPLTPLAAVKKSPPPGPAQIDLGLGADEEPARFKGTEPAIAPGGENLDVPTWKRLKMKLKR